MGRRKRSSSSSSSPSQSRTPRRKRSERVVSSKDAKKVREKASARSPLKKKESRRLSKRGRKPSPLVVKAHAKKTIGREDKKAEKKASSKGRGREEGGRGAGGHRGPQPGPQPPRPGRGERARDEEKEKRDKEAKAKEKDGSKRGEKRRGRDRERVSLSRERGSKRGRVEEKEQKDRSGKSRSLEKNGENAWAAAAAGAAAWGKAWAGWYSASNWTRGVVGEAATGPQGNGRAEWSTRPQGNGRAEDWNDRGRQGAGAGAYGNRRNDPTWKEAWVPGLGRNFDLENERNGVAGTRRLFLAHDDRSVAAPSGGEYRPLGRLSISPTCWKHDCYEEIVLGKSREAETKATSAPEVDEEGQPDEGGPPTEDGRPVEMADWGQAEDAADDEGPTGTRRRDAEGERRASLSHKKEDLLSARVHQVGSSEDID